MTTINLPASGAPGGGAARHSRLLLYLNVLKSGGTAIGSPRAGEPVTPVVEAYDLLHALDADIELRR